MLSFAESGLREELLRAVEEVGFVNPTPIQTKAIPHVLNENRDLIAFAQTGTGKTAAFGLPLLHLTNIKDKSTQVLVLCPTRELCIQITKDFNAFAKYLKELNVVAVYGGSSIEAQIKALKKGAQIVVGTPGRTKDLIKRKRLLLGNVSHVVLDEADEMLTMGFKDDLEAILNQIPPARQTLLFSATMSKEMKSVTGKYMNDPEQISVAQLNKGAENVNHIYYMVHARDRYEALKRIADINPNIYGIIFCRTRRETKEVANKLMHDGYNADAIHGDLSQSQRDEVMGKFRKRQLQLLVATDVAARGLDVNDLTHVINYNLPDDIQNYVHRSGRTGRAGKSGTSIAIIHTREGRKIRDIERAAKITFKQENVPTGKDVCTKQLYSLIDKIERVEVDEHQIEPFLPAIYQKLQWLDREQLIKHFVSAEFNRFLSYYKGARDLNVEHRPRDDRRRESRGKDGRKKDSRRKSYSRFYINLGSKNNLSPANLIGLINESLDSSEAGIGQIEILKKFSFFEIEKGWEPMVLATMNDRQWGSVRVSVQESQAGPSQYSGQKKKKKKFSPNFEGRQRKGKKKFFKGGKGKRKSRN